MPLGLSSLLSRAVNETLHLLSFQIPQRPAPRGVLIHLIKYARHRTAKFVRRSVASVRTVLLATIIPVALVPLFLYVMWWAIRRFWIRGSRSLNRPRPEDHQRGDDGEDGSPNRNRIPMHPLVGDRDRNLNPAVESEERPVLPLPERQRSQTVLRGDGSDTHSHHFQRTTDIPRNPPRLPELQLPDIRISKRHGDNSKSHNNSRSQSRSRQGSSRSRSQSRSRPESSHDGSDVIDISPRPPSGMSITTRGTAGESRPPSSMAHYGELGRHSYEVGRTSSLSATRPWIATNVGSGSGSGSGTYTSTTRRASEATSFFSAQTTLTPLSPVPPVPPVPQLPPIQRQAQFQDLPPLAPVPQLPALPPPPLSPLPPVPTNQPPDHSPTTYSPRRSRPLPVAPQSQSSGDGSGSGGGGAHRGSGSGSGSGGSGSGTVTGHDRDRDRRSGNSANA